MARVNVKVSLKDKKQFKRDVLDLDTTMTQVVRDAMDTTARRAKEYRELRDEATVEEITP